MNPVTELETARIDELLGAFRELQAQFDLMRERLRRADEHRHTVARRIYDRVRSDYDHELDAIRARLTPLRDDLDRVHETLEAQCRETGAAAHAIEEELAEADFRHRIGEFQPVAFDDMRRALDARASEARARQATIQSALDAIASARATGTPAAAPTPPAVEEAAVSLAGTDDVAEAMPVAAGDEDDFSSLIVDEPPSLDRGYGISPAPEPAAPEGNDAEAHDAPTEAHTSFSPEGVEDVRLDAEATVAEVFADDPHVAPDADAASVQEFADEPHVPQAADAPAPAAHPRVDSFENPQAWVSEIGANRARPERRVRLSAPLPVPVRAAAPRDEFDAVLAPLEGPVATAAPVRAPVTSPTDAGSLPSLVFVSGPHAGQAIALLPTTLTIGREHDNNVEIKDADVARYHARILRERDAFVVEDLNSSTGTWVNGERKNRTVLAHGDVIRVGQTELALDFEWTTDSR